MKGDFSRNTFDRDRHFSSVRMQQGRVQLDADWNEQVDIVDHRIATESMDTLGVYGAPFDAAGFRIVTALADLSEAEKSQPGNQSAPTLTGKGDFYLTAGRFYVHGTLCECDRLTSFARQADLPGVTCITEPGLYLAYLDVWQRCITALEAPAIREVALGGPDTATRTRTVWQVKLMLLGDPGAVASGTSAAEALRNHTTPPTGKLAARAEPGSGGASILPPGAGYRRLENQLYRIEVHKAGARGTATFKWSRDNGAVVARWDQQSGNDIVVSSIGRDKTVQLGPGAWVELIDDERELRGEPGTLVRIDQVNGRILTLNPTTADGPITLSSFQTTPKVRRWDGNGALIPASGGWLNLEDGIQVSVTEGTYRTGDYWTVPARSDIGAIQWPTVAGAPATLAPAGVAHRAISLALLQFDGTQFASVTDCRPLVPTLNQMVRLAYVGGDGQETLPGAELDRPLQVGVANGDRPVAGARIRFRRADAQGELLAGSRPADDSGNGAERIVRTGVDGIAECRWRLGPDNGPVTQLVEATLLRDDGAATQQLPVRFQARLSLAAQVAYDGAGCKPLGSAGTVQQAIDILAAQAVLSPLSGDGQTYAPGTPVPLPIRVVVTSACSAVDKAQVRFTPEGKGKISSSRGGLTDATPGQPADVGTTSDGVAEAYWQPDPDPAAKSPQLMVELIRAGERQLRAPARCVFTAYAAASVTDYNRYFDELRSDGVTRGGENLGLQVTATADRKLLAYSAGIAYVRGHRFEVATGTLPLESDGQATVLVDERGQVVVTPAGTDVVGARLADVVVTEGQVRRIIDRRRDLTHLDERLDDLATTTAGRRPDRRSMIPLLTQTLPGLRYADGRTLRIPLKGARQTLFDGQSIWVMTETGVQRVHPRLEDPIDLKLGTPSFMAYDGLAHVWVALPGTAVPGEPAIGGRVASVNVHTNEVRTVDLVDRPVAIASDGVSVWVALSLPMVAVISPEQHTVRRTIRLGSSGDFLKHWSMAYDGSAMWVVAVSGQLFKIPPERESQMIGRGWTTRAGLAFDGSHLWGCGDGGNHRVLKMDVVTHQLTRLDFLADSLTCDGSTMWSLGPSTEPGTPLLLRAVDCATGGERGRIDIPETQKATGNMTFDGTFLWLMVNDVGFSGLVRLLVS